MSESFFASKHEESHVIHSKDLFLGNTRSRSRLTIPHDFLSTFMLLIPEVKKISQIYRHWSDTESPAIQEYTKMIGVMLPSSSESKSVIDLEDSKSVYLSQEELNKIICLNNYANKIKAAYLSYHENVMSLLDTELIDSVLKYTNQNKLKFLQKMIFDLMRLVESVYHYLALKYQNKIQDFDSIDLELMTLQQISQKSLMLERFYELPPSQLYHYNRKRIQAPKQDEKEMNVDHPLKRL